MAPLIRATPARHTHHRHSPMRNCASLGALLREPGIHNPGREYGFRACASGRLSPTEGPSRNDERWFSPTRNGFSVQKQGRTMIGYITIGALDTEQAKTFYDSVLATVG